MNRPSNFLATNPSAINGALTTTTLPSRVLGKVTTRPLSRQVCEYPGRTNVKPMIAITIPLNIVLFLIPTTKIIHLFEENLFFGHIHVF